MLDDLTPEEIVALVQLMKATDSIADHGVVVLVAGPNDVMTTFDNLPGAMSLAEKIGISGEREDVKKYIADNYG